MEEFVLRPFFKEILLYSYLEITGAQKKTKSSEQKTNKKTRITEHKKTQCDKTKQTKIKSHLAK